MSEQKNEFKGFDFFEFHQKSDFKGFEEWRKTF